MADKFFIADKETLDEVHDRVGKTDDDYDVGIGTGTVFSKLNKVIWWMLTNLPASLNSKVNDIHRRVGQYDDGNYTGDAATLMGKLNYLVTVSGNNIIGWNNCKTNLDATISSRQSEADALSRYNSLHRLATDNEVNISDIMAQVGSGNNEDPEGNLSEKLSYIIDHMRSMKQKKLASKQLNFESSTPGTHTILEIEGGGQFEYAETSMGTSSAILIIEADGEIFTFANKNGTGLVGRFMNYPREGLTRVESGSFNNSPYVIWQPFHFKDRLTITVEKTNSDASFFRGHYSVYE